MYRQDANGVLPVGGGDGLLGTALVPPVEEVVQVGMFFLGELRHLVQEGLGKYLFGCGDRGAHHPQ